MAAKRIWLVRHGQSQSQTGESNDLLNPPLSDLGIVQAKRLVGPLCDLELDCILLSPLRRAWHTYQLSQARAERVEFDSRLIESDWGNLHRYAPILPVKTPDIAQLDQHDAWLLPVQDRALSIVQDLAKANWPSVLLFGHWGVFSRIFMAFTGLNVHSQTFTATMDNAAISLFEIDDEQNRFVRYWNERAHVMDLLL